MTQNDASKEPAGPGREIELITFFAQQKSESDGPPRCAPTPMWPPIAAVIGATMAPAAAGVEMPGPVGFFARR